jgi:paraquat-inducible protein A
MHLPMTVVACEECDLLQSEPVVGPGRSVRCIRCGAWLFRVQPGWLNRALAFTLAAMVTFVIANMFPIVGLRFNGQVIETTLFGAASTLYDEKMYSIAVLVFCTTILAPLLEMTATAWLLLPLRAGHKPTKPDLAFRLLRFVQPWGLIEVFLLALLVAVVKLAAIATVIPGISLWAFGALMLLLAAADSALDTRELWATLGEAPK